MANTNVYTLQHSDLNEFLFADIGIEANGMSLSVLSALSRLGLDPWQEAGRLAKLPRAVAAEGLARTIATMPASLWSAADAASIATRLVALLPAGGTHPAPIRHAPAWRRILRQWGLVLVLLALTLAGVVANYVIHQRANPTEAAAPLVPPAPPMPKG